MGSDGLASPLKAAKCIMEHDFKISHQEGLYTGRTLVQGRWEVLVRVINVDDGVPLLEEGIALGDCEPVT
jgi:hypothetical protein